MVSSHLPNQLERLDLLHSVADFDLDMKIHDQMHHGNHQMHHHQGLEEPGMTELSQHGHNLQSYHLEHCLGLAQKIHRIRQQLGMRSDYTVLQDQRRKD